MEKVDVIPVEDSVEEDVQVPKEQHMEAAQYEEVPVEEGPDPQTSHNFFLTSQLNPNHRFRSSWTEERIMTLLDLYINEHPAYLKAKAERQITDFHDFIGRLVDADGIIVSGLLKNLGREYRKTWSQRNGSVSQSNMKLRGSRALCQKFDQYYKLYSRIGLREPRKIRKQSTLAHHSTPKASPGLNPKIKKIRKQPPAPFPGGTVLENMMTPPQMKIPPVSVMSDKYCQEYIDVMREQNQALLEIGKELRLMRMGYFTEHELAMDS